MGNQLSQATQAGGYQDQQVLQQRLGAFQAVDQLGGGRFLKSFLCFHDEGQLVMKVRADYPTKITASMLSLSVPVPKSTLSVSFPSGAKGTFSEKERKLSWSLRKVQGGAEHVLVARISLNNQANVSIKKEFGPVSLNFSLPMFNSSKLQVKYLQILDQSYEKGQNPSRWVRYITESGSYICRM